MITSHVKEARRAMELYFPNAPTVFDVIYLDLRPKQTAALCAVILETGLKAAGVKSADLVSAISALTRAKSGSARDRIDIVEAEASRRAAKIISDARSAAEVWEREERERVRKACFYILQEARDRAAIVGRSPN